MSVAEKTNANEHRRLLIIDDDEGILSFLRKTFETAPVIIHTASSCGEARRVLQSQSEIAVVMCDQMLPDGEGVDFLHELRTQYPWAIRILITGYYDVEVALNAINQGEIYRFIGKPTTPEQLRSVLEQALAQFNLVAENRRLQAQLAIQNEALRQANQELSRRIHEETSRSEDLLQQSADWKKACAQLIDLILEVLQRVDEPLFKHSQRVARLSTAIANDMGFDPSEIDKLEIAALMHDLGLLGATYPLKQNQRDLLKIQNESEREMVRNHASTSASLVHFLPQTDIVKTIAQHHEHINGSGYPHGLSGDNISTLATILAVADAFDEFSGSPDFALSHITSQSGILFHPEVVRSLNRLMECGEYSLTSEKQVLVHELQPGMKLVHSIYTSSGMLLVQQGQILTEPIIRKLQQHNMAHAIRQTLYVQT